MTLKRRLIIIILLALFSAYLFFTGLTATALWEEDEVWYAQVAREMVSNQDYVTPTFAGEPFFHKPPLFFWLIALTGKSFGFSEFSVRLVSVGAAIATVVLTFLIGEMLFGGMVGAGAALILTTSFQFMLQARLAYLDPLLTLFITLAFYFFGRGYLKQKPINYIWFYGAMGLATITKGPIGLLLPAGAIFLFLLVRREFKEIKNTFLNWGILLFLMIILPWYVLETVRHGWAFLQDHFGYHMLARFAQGIEAHVEPWYYYVVILFLGFLPWSTFLPTTFLYVKRTIRQKEILLTVSWAAVIFIFFSISKSKLPGYILSSYVPFALLVAVAIIAFVKNREAITWKGIFGSLLLLFLLLLALGFFFLYVVTSVASGVVGLLPRLGPIIWTLVLGALVILGSFCWRPRRGYFILALLLLVVVLNVFLANQILPLAESVRYMKPLGEKLSSLTDTNLRIANYDYYSRGLMYYSGGQNIEVVRSEKEIIDYLSSAEKVYLVMSAWMKNKLFVEKILDQVPSAKIFHQSNHGVIITN